MRIKARCKGFLFNCSQAKREHEGVKKQKAGPRSKGRMVLIQKIKNEATMFI